MAKLTQLSITKFRNVAPTTLEFRPGLNVLLGKNAAGKTTLLRLLSTVSGQPDEALQEDELEVSYQAANVLSQLEFEHAISRKRITAHSLSPSGMLKNVFRIQEISTFVFKEGGVLTKVQLLPGEIILEREGYTFRAERRFNDQPMLSIIQAVILDVHPPAVGNLKTKIASARLLNAGRMDESLERFNELLTLKVESEWRDENSHLIWDWNLQHLPESMLVSVFEPVVEAVSSVVVSPTFLNQAAQVLGYDSAEMRFDVERLNSAPNRQITRLSNLRFFFKRPGEEISHELLSYGQKRLLAFFAHVDASPDVVIADELVNGLHHEWISACLDEIGERQAFLTSQNPLLLDFLRFEDAEEVRRTFILCERGGGEASAQLIWRNPTMDEAESFFSAYQTGIQRVSDILLTKGLW